VSLSSVQLLELEAAAYTAARFPTFPKDYTPKKKYDVKTANGLTSAIRDFLKFRGHHSERINVGGIMRDGRYTKSGSTRGSADIIACINGQYVAIEVKIGADKQSPDQIDIEKSIKASQGHYFIARTFEDFVSWYVATFKNKNAGL
jgi:hypothetical protein